MNAEPTRPFAAASPVARAWLPLAFALLPLLATHLAYALSIREGFAPACVPYWDGCTSISRAARHGSASLVFKAVLLPCSLLLALLWWQAGRRLHRGAASAWPMVLAGGVGALALALYVSFLGLDGTLARGLRRYGALAYFAATFLAQLVYLRACWQVERPHAALRLMGAACLLLLLGGLASTAASALVREVALKDRIENAIEWNLGALFTLWFLALAWHWCAVPTGQLPPANTRAPPPPRSG